MNAPSPLGPRTTLTVNPLTDWHVGAGYGIPGSIDAVVVRDTDDLPYVPGTTLTGLLRDAARTVAEALDDGAPSGAWQRWHRVAFGDAVAEGPPLFGRRLTQAALSITAARLPPRVRTVLTGSPELRAATVVLRPGVRIDEESGRAQDDMFRIVELARGGMPLQATVNLDVSAVHGPDATTAVTALVVLAVAWCDRLGGDRRRGPGEALLDLGGQQASAWAAWLAESGWSPSDPLPATAATAPAVEVGTGIDWVSLDVEITTVDPVRAQARTAGNVMDGHDYVPGNLLLPWLSDRWGAELVRVTVASDGLIVRHAHPQVCAERGVPVPFTLFRAKGETSTVSVGAPADGERQVRDRWTVATPVDGVVALQSRDTAYASHNQVDRASQRPTGATGVFQVEVIPPGRRLRGRVLLTGAVVKALRTAHGDSWAELLAGPAWFGARRGGEYGGCTVAVDGPVPVMVPPVPAPGPVMLWAAAEVLVRSPALRPSADPADLTRALRRLLGVEVTLTRVTARTRRRDGWQGRWQLPRESLIGLAAGSVLEVDIPAQVDPAGWAQLVVAGLGERRAEGFGEVLADPGLLARTGTLAAADRVPDHHAPAPPTGEPNDAERATVDLVTRVARRAEIHAAVAAARGGPRYGEVRAAFARLSRSQQGTWRAVTADAATAGEPARVTDHARGWLEKRNPRRAEQRAVAALLSGLDIGFPDLVAESDAERALMLAVVVADVIDALARDGSRS